MKNSDIIIFAKAGFQLNLNGIHGLAHWSRVRAIGLEIASHYPEVDSRVVELFALLHDHRRWDDGHDPDHGQRAADSVEALGREALNISELQFAKLRAAMIGHTGTLFSHDKTIACCWDADRLDLWRCGTIPDPKYLNLEISKKLIEKGIKRSEHWRQKRYIIPLMN
jgi:uncharacterized protein